MKKAALCLLISVILSSCSFSFPPKKNISIGEQVFICEIAQNQKERQEGLMNRKTLPKNHGMLFIFEKPDLHSFWMKDTPMALDIIWIDEQDSVSHFITAPPCKTKECPIYRPEIIAKYVVEVAGGTFKGEIGDKFRFDK